METQTTTATAVSENAGPLLAVIDYGMGNLRSVSNAFEAVGARVQTVHSPSEIGDAAGLVLPGVGALGDCISALKNAGLDESVRQWIADDRPFLGVCLGLQALFAHSEEGDVTGLGIFPGEVRRFRLPPEYKIPHMGWNAVRFAKDRPLNAGLDRENDQFYFVHSYRVETPDADLVWTETDYGGPFVSGINRGSCYAVQFHPEKSQANGLALYRNFVTLAGGV